MKKRDILSLLYQLASPIALMVLGLVLLVSPDSASAMIARLLGWLMTLTGIGIGLWAIIDRRNAVGKGIMAVGCACIGGWLLANPLLLAAWIGRLLGILILLRGGRDVFLARSRGHGQTLALITLAVGIVLIVLPMTTSRLVFRLLGLVIALIGAAMLLDRLKDRRYLDAGDSDIIDAL